MKIKKAANFNAIGIVDSKLNIKTIYPGDESCVFKKGLESFEKSR